MHKEIGIMVDSWMMFFITISSHHDFQYILHTTLDDIDAHEFSLQCQQKMTEIKWASRSLIKVACVWMHENNFKCFVTKIVVGHLILTINLISDINSVCKSSKVVVRKHHIIFNAAKL